MGQVIMLQPEATAESLIASITDHIQKGQLAASRAHNQQGMSQKHLYLAGQELKELRPLVPHGAWAKTCEQIGISESYASRLIVEANGGRSRAERNEQAKGGMTKHRANRANEDVSTISSDTEPREMTKRVSDFVHQFRLMNEQEREHGMALCNAIWR